jgi:hypothetical protein
MSTILIESKLAREIEDRIRKNTGIETLDVLNKALGHKYIRKWPSKNPNRNWDYLYARDLLRPISALKRLFGFEDKKITTDFEQNAIKKTYGVDKKTFANHILEYLTNRVKWDKIFSQSASRARYSQPVKHKIVVASATAEKIDGDDNPQPSLFVEKKKKQDPSTIVNRSLMKKVWDIYNPEKAKEDDKIKVIYAGTEMKLKLDDVKRLMDQNPGAVYVDEKDLAAYNLRQGAKDGKKQDSPKAGSAELQAGTQAVRAAGSEGASDLDVPSGGASDNAGKSGGPTDESGRSPGRDVRGRGVRSSIKDVREQVKKLLAEKKDDEFTEEDKELLRQYEGGGGLAEEGATLHGTLYEYYTPQKVVDKVWSLVDKYNPSPDKDVIEPSAGTGRFAEGREENFDLFELDETSARIAGILHPDATVVQGHFQDLFMNGNTPKKAYTGKKYDVAVGNPPYGIYAGKHKGLGEGKEHKKIDEYFIDRSLDTLKDGGILAMVVPSSFLRSKASKGKDKIAGKATLLEAWRLPNGTFGTTGIGTDIIVLKKEPGDAAQFNDDAYFSAHEDQIAGVEIEKKGRFGMEKYVGPLDGMSFDQSLDTIDPEKVAYVGKGEKDAKAEAMEEVVAVVSEAEEHRNRSEAMKGNDNAYKGGPKDGFIGKEIAKLEAQIKDERERLARKEEAESEGKTLVGVGYITKEYLAEHEAELSRLKNDSTADTTARLIEMRNERILMLENSLEEWKKRGENLKGKQLKSHKGAIKTTEEQIWELQQEIKSLETEESKRSLSEAMKGNKNAEGDRGGSKADLGEINRKIRALEKEQKLEYEMMKMQDKMDEDILAQQHRNSAQAIGRQIDELRRQKAEIEASAPAPAAGEQQKQGRKGKADMSDSYVRSTGKNMSVDEYNEKYGVKVKKADMPIWAATNYDGIIEVSKLSAKERKHLTSSEDFTVDAHGNWYSVANYASGNIYEKLDQLERDKELIISTMGQGVYDKNKALLEAAKLPPKAAENIHFSPISDFVKEYFVTTDEGKQVDLREAFRQWARVRSYGYGRRAYQDWDSDSSPISEYEIPPNISFNDVMAYIRQEPQKTDKSTAKEFDSDTARMEAAKKREARRECAERLFNRFIREGLPEDKRSALVAAYNRRHFAVVNPDYSKIPVFIKGMNTHKGTKKFDLVDKQVETISFACNKGSGVSAAEVGVGKTVIGEAIAVNQLVTGRAKKPLNLVPKAVIDKWVQEYHQHFPEMNVIKLHNLSDKYVAPYRGADGKLNLPENTIFVCTYEALQKITFKDETLDTDLIDDLLDSQTIYDANTQEKRTPKEKADEKNKLMKTLGKGAKSKEGAFYWEDLGFDCVIVDELHNFKNVFGQARVFGASNKDPGEKERHSNEFKNLAGLTPSDKAVKLFAITQLIQKENNGRNVFGLSATPFTNSPIEVYNILSLIARNKLKELHIYNMHAFLAEFAEIKTEWSVGPNGEIVEKEVMKNWKNLGALQNLISEYMFYVKADDAGVVRPRKKVHLPQLELTPLQRAIIAAETSYMANADPKEDPGAILKAINNMRMATLTPASIRPERIREYQSEYREFFKGLTFPSPKDFVTASPKMKFVCDSVAAAYKQLPDAGQIIYLPRGVNDFVHVKQYLIDHGMPEDSIAFMSSDTSMDEKDRIKKDFNDTNGRIKVIIGSETIKEGVSLNGNTHSIYNCMLGWNPTEPIQVEGRAWRQNNKQGHVHVVYPLMADSIDSLMYQKYDEKSSRIDEIWSYKGDVSNDVSDINPETLKFDLIKDPAKKANLIVGQKRDKIIADRRIEEARYEVLFKDQRNYESAMESLPELKRDMDIAEAAMLKRREERDEAQKAYDKVKNGERYASMDAQRKLDHAKYMLETDTATFRRERRAWKESQDDVDMYLAKFRKMGVKPERIEDKLKEIAATIQGMKEDEQNIKDSYNVELAKAKKELEAQRQKLPPLESIIAANVKTIMGDLRPMDEVKEEIKKEREAAAKLLQKALGSGKILVLKIKRPKAEKKA